MGNRLYFSLIHILLFFCYGFVYLTKCDNFLASPSHYSWTFVYTDSTCLKIFYCIKQSHDDFIISTLLLITIAGFVVIAS